MQQTPTASLDEAELSGYRQLRFVRTVMQIIGEELNADEPLSQGKTFEAIFAALSSGAAEPDGMAEPFHVEGSILSVGFQIESLIYLRQNHDLLGLYQGAIFQ